MKYYFRLYCNWFETQKITLEKAQKHTKEMKLINNDVTSSNQKISYSATQNIFVILDLSIKFK